MVLISDSAFICIGEMLLYMEIKFKILISTLDFPL